MNFIGFVRYLIDFHVKLRKIAEKIHKNKQENIKKAEGNYVRDGIKFKSKEDLEAYFESQSK